MIIGITGYIGVGKTTAAKYVSEKYDFKIIDVDALGHELLKSGEVRQSIVAEFGEKILGRNLEIDRKKLAEIVFSNTDLLQRLNKIIHVKLKENLKRIISENKEKNENVVIDVALLAEFELGRFCDFVIIIKTGIDRVYARLTKGYDKKQIINIMNNQKMPEKYDYIVENNDDLDKFKARLGQVIGKIQR